MKKKNNAHNTIHLVLVTVFLLVFVSGSLAQSLDSRADNQPALTQKMVEDYITIYEFLLDIKLNAQQQKRVQSGLTLYWKTRNREAIHQTLSDLAYFGKHDELEALRNSSQLVFVQAFRQDSTDTVSKVFVEAYDKTHPDKIGATAAIVFTDLIGLWKRTDGLLSESTYNAQRSGVSYTTSETMEFTAGGKFKRVSVHSHYSGNCSQLDGTTEYGTVEIAGSKLVFNVQSGSRQVTDGCTPGLNQKIKVTAHTSKFTCSLRNSGKNRSVSTLCLSSMDGISTCLVKE